MATYMVSIGWLLCLAFLCGWRFLNKISLGWPHTLTTQPSTSKLSDNPVLVAQITAQHCMEGWGRESSGAPSDFFL